MSPNKKNLPSLSHRLSLSFSPSPLPLSLPLPFCSHSRCSGDFQTRMPSPGTSVAGRWLVLVVMNVSVLLLLLLLLASASTCGGFPSRLTLERRLPEGNDIDALMSRDRLRHARLLQQQHRRRRLQQASSSSSAASTSGVVDFPVDGSSNPNTVGLYFTRVKLGNPPKEFYVQIDTGSDILWVTCNPCNGCPNTSGLNLELESFDPEKSSSALLVSCSDKRCGYGLQSSEAGCTSSSENSICGYSFQYGDGSGTSGFYVLDTMHFETVIADEVTANSSANIIFGCSNSQSGDLTKPDLAVDGIFGFGQHDMSVISQLSSLGVAPKVFSHCLKGSDSGGGILVLGEIVASDIIYTPLVQNQPHYNLNLESIAVNGQILPIDSSVFATSSTQGTIVDSGTTLTYLAEQAYDPFVDAITAFVSQSVQSIVSKGHQCFITSSRVDEVFPPVTLNFEGSGSMILNPQDYLLQLVSVDNAIVWCMGWQKNQGQGITILGDLVLKDKIFVYDLVRQRIGWANYDCSMSVNVSTSGKNEYVKNGQLSIGSPSNVFYNLIFFFAGVFLYMLFHFPSYIDYMP